MRILGVDPGTAVTGYGVIDEGPRGGVVAVAYGVIQTAAGESVASRLADIYRRMAGLIAEYQPDWLAIEELFFNKNVRTALSVGQARGVTLLAAAQAGLPVAEYTPLQVKQAISNYGRASKQQMQRMVQIILGLAEIPQPDDAADALAVALCHAQVYRWQKVTSHD